MPPAPAELRRAGVRGPVARGPPREKGNDGQPEITIVPSQTASLFCLLKPPHLAFLNRSGRVQAAVFQKDQRKQSEAVARIRGIAFLRARKRAGAIS